MKNEDILKNKRRLPTSNWIDRSCCLCEKNFKVKPYLVRINKGKYCSLKCSNTIKGKKASLEKNNFIGFNNPNWNGGLTKQRYRYKLIDKSRYPEKHKARDIVKKAKKSGKLISSPCVACGNSKVHAHHEDYSRPLDVKWLCVKCHRIEHK